MAGYKSVTSILEGVDNTLCVSPSLWNEKILIFLCVCALGDVCLSVVPLSMCVLECVRECECVPECVSECVSVCPSVCSSV